MSVMPVKQHNHHCIVCGSGYHFCNDCNKVASFTPWRKIACSVECYQAHLAYIEYRDITHDVKKFADMVDCCGIQVDKMHEVMREAYALGAEERKISEENTGEVMFVDGANAKKETSKPVKARRK